MTSRGHLCRLRRGLTLLEVVLAMSLLVILSSMTYWFYASSLDTRERGRTEAHRLRLVRVTLDRIATEIRQASTITADNRVGIRGEAERIWLSSLRVPNKKLSEERRSREAPLPAEYDLAKVAYHIVRHPDIRDDDGYERPLGLARVEIRTQRPDSAETGEAFEGEHLQTEVPEGEEVEEEIPLEDFEEALPGEEEEIADMGLLSEIEWEELYAPEIRYLRFCYFDGKTWWDTWDVPGENPLPQLVMVTIGFEGCAPFGEELGRTPNEEFCECLNREPEDCERLLPDQYSQVVRVAQADPLFRSRITREGQKLVEDLGAASGEESEEEGGLP